MSERPFRSPLIAKLDGSGRYIVRSAWEALDYLQTYWQGPRNPTYERALRLCRDALDGWVSPQRARHAFKQALLSAHLWVKT